jgi:hypothetical protein
MSWPEEEPDRPPPQCLLIFALSALLWILILFGITYTIYWLLN